MRGDYITRWGANTAWAIMPDSLAQMVDFALRDKLDTADAIKLVEAQTARPMNDKSAVRMRGDVAIIDIIGPIFRYGDAFSAISGATTLDALAASYNEALDNPTVKSIILNVDSPGGEAKGIGEFAAMIAAQREKPVIAYVGGYCCSAAYWIAAAADSIVAAPSASVGCIGAVVAVPNPDSAREHGTIEFVSSQTPNKRPDIRTEGGKQLVQDRVDAMAQVFIEDVARLRNTTPDKIIATKGDTYIAATPQGAELIDKLGTFEGVILSLSKKKPQYMGGTHMADKTLGEKFMDFLKGEGVIDAPATPEIAAAAAVPTLDPAIAAELETLRSERAANNERALRADATAFTREIVLTGKALPAEQDDLIEMYVSLAMDDQRHGGSRVDRFKALQMKRGAHTLTGTTTEPAQLRVVENKTTTPKPAEHTGPMSPERRVALLLQTPEGQEAAKARGLI